MKLNKKVNDVERANVGVESTFTMKTSAQAFDILSSGLYSDPILAIIRELSCNAYDSHIQAGKDNVPFEIYLPTTLNSVFRVIDHGLGLSDEEIQGELTETVNDNNETVHVRKGGLYTTYFDSTKNDSNDVIGALGLGSKSPFSYTSSFQVISRYGGKKSTYAVFLNEQGIPSVAKMAEVDTDECNGLEIRIPVKKKDYSEFADKTKKALQFFYKKPIIHSGDSNFTITPFPEAFLSGKDWLIDVKFKTFTRSPGNAYAIQGGVCYPIDIGFFEDCHLLQSLRSSIYIWFDIGDLSVAASREYLHYDQFTIDNIKNKLDEVSYQIVNDMKQEIDQYSEWDTILHLKSLSKKFHLNSFVGMFLNHFHDDKIQKIKDNNFYYYFDSKWYTKLNIDFYQRTGFTINFKRQSSLINNIKNNVVSPTTIRTIVVNDIKTGCIKRMSSIKYNNVMVIQPLKDPTLKKEVSFHKEVQNFLNEINTKKIEIVYASTLPDDSVKEQRSKLPAYTFSLAYQRWNRENDFDVNKGGYYLHLHRGSVPYVDKKTPAEWLRDFRYYVPYLEYMTKSNNPTQQYPHIRGVSTSTYSHVVQSEKWFNIFDEFDKFVFKNENMIKHGLSMFNYSRSTLLFMLIDKVGFNNNNSEEFTKILEKQLEQVDNDSLFKINIEFLLQNNKQFSKWINGVLSYCSQNYNRKYDGEQFLRMLQSYMTHIKGYKREDIKNPNNVLDYDQLLQVYPILGVEGLTILRDNDVEKFIGYINQTDKLREKEN